MEVFSHLRRSSLRAVAGVAFLATAVGALFAFLGADAAAAAEPHYRCARLEATDGAAGSAALTQGMDGWFFRGPASDLSEFYRPDAEGAALVGRLAAALSARGTRFVVVPVPPRGLLAADRLDASQPQQAIFSPSEATAEYQALVAALTRPGVSVANLNPDAIRGRLGAGFFLKRDPRWSPDGAKFAAEAAASAMARPGASQFVTRSSGSAPVTGIMQAVINRLCDETVPAQTVSLYTTEGAANPSPMSITLVGDDLAHDTVGNFAGFLAQAARSTVVDKSIPEAGPVTSLLSYLESPEFDQAPPPAIVWQTMASAPLSADTIALRQMIGAANGSCAGSDRLVASGGTTVDGSGEVVAVPATTSVPPGAYLALTMAGTPIDRFTIEVEYGDGDVDAVSINQAPPFVDAGRTFLAFSGDFTGTPTRVRLIGLPAGSRVPVTAEICRPRVAS